MKKKRFYNNKGRGEKWTEKPVGRKIYFADKYIDENDGNHKFDKKQQKTKKPFFTNDRLEKALRIVIVAVCSIFIIGVGYTVMDVHLELNAMPKEQNNTIDVADLNNIKMDVKGTDCQGLSLDNGVMLSSVVDTAFEEGYSSIAFELKRNDGTIGYNSQLATVTAYGAISSPSSDLEGSVRFLINNDILPIGKISCYKDSIAANADLSSAVLKAGRLYKDEGGNAYLNPNADGTYSYIKSIVEEARGLGISVFILDNYNLPNDITAEYNDGFEKISTRLYNDFDDIKLFKAVNINLNAENAKALDVQFKEKTKSLNINDNETMLYITAKNKAMVKQYLDDRTITNYIICE